MKKTTLPKKKIPDVIETKEQRHLKCELTDTELLSKGNELANKMDQIAALEDTKKAYVTQLKAQTDELTAQTKVLQGAVRNKWEFRMVECIHRMFRKSCVVTVVRQDTEQKIVDRKMTMDERQSNLFQDE